MNITSVSLQPGGSLQPVPCSWFVSTPLGEFPQQLFRQTLYLRFAATDLAERIVLDRATSFQATFHRQELNALSPGLPIAAATRTQKGDAVIVDLQGIRQLRQIRLVAGKAISSGSVLEVYRLDGDVLASQPTAIAAIQSNLATLEADFTDTRFALRLKRNSGQYDPLLGEDLSEITVRSFPTSPRISLAIAAPLEPLVFWQQPGEFREATAVAPLVAEASAALVETLQRSLSRLAAPLPAAVDVALIIESDAPCQVTIAACNLVYYLVRSAFTSVDGHSSALEKQVLRFTGDRLQSQSVALFLPRAAKVRHARLKVVESFRAEHPATLTPATASPNLLQRTGIQLVPDQWIAQVIIPSETVVMSGVVLGLMAIVAPTELHIEIQDDFQGQPSTRTLAAGTLTLSSLNEPAYLTVHFDTAIALQPQSYWLLVQVNRGAAIWLVQDSSQSTQILEKNAQTNTWLVVSAFDQRQAIYQFLSPSSPIAEGSSGSQRPIVQLAIGNEGVPAVTQVQPATDAKFFDLALPLNTYLSHQSSALDQVIISLSFTTMVPGILTVYQPQVEFDL